MSGRPAPGRMDPPPPPGRPGRAGAGRGGKAGGRGGKAGGRGGRGGAAVPAEAKELAEMDDRSVQHESKIEILRAQRAARRSGKAPTVHDSVRENEGVDEEDPLMVFDDGIRLEPFNMRREMAEGHFDEGGFYILNKQEEKKVTDAWLDTVDQAEKAAAFRRLDRQAKAKERATNRLEALSKNLGETDEEEEEEDEEAQKGEKEAGEEEKPGKKEAAAPKAQPPAQEEELDDDPAKEIALLEELIGELLPLEKPCEALARWQRGRTVPSGGSSREVPEAPQALLKLRARKRQARESESAGDPKPGEGSGKAARHDEAALSCKPRKRKLTEFGDYEERPAKKQPAEEGAVAAVERAAATAEGAAGLASGSEQPGRAADAAATGGTSGRATTTGEGSAASPVAVAAGSTVADAAAVAAAEEKAVALEKAAAEVAAAANEMRQTRQTLHVELDAKTGPEAAAFFTPQAEEPRAAREEKGVAPVPEAEPDVRPADQPMRRRNVVLDAAELQRRKKIERLTDLCDRLLERGVLVYDSTREALAIEVRERKGEQFGAEQSTKAKKEEEEEEAEMKDKVGNDGAVGDVKAEEDPQASRGQGDGVDAAAVQQAPQLLLVNSRCHPPVAANGSTVPEQGLLGLLQEVEARGGGNGAEQAVAREAAPDSLCWQYRWVGSSEVHGPFDSVTMHGWVTQACFAPERPAEVRQCDAANQPLEQCWHQWQEVNFSLYL